MCMKYQYKNCYYTNTFAKVQICKPHIQHVLPADLNCLPCVLYKNTYLTSTASSNSCISTGYSGNDILQNTLSQSVCHIRYTMLHSPILCLLKHPCNMLGVIPIKGSVTPPRIFFSPLKNFYILNAMFRQSKNQ